MYRTAMILAALLATGCDTDHDHDHAHELPAHDHTHEHAPVEHQDHDPAEHEHALPDHTHEQPWHEHPSDCWSVDASGYGVAACIPALEGFTVLDGFGQTLTYGDQGHLTQRCDTDGCWDFGYNGEGAVVTDDTGAELHQIAVVPTS